MVDIDNNKLIIEKESLMQIETKLKTTLAVKVGVFVIMAAAVVIGGLLAILLMGGFNQSSIVEAPPKIVKDQFLIDDFQPIGMANPAAVYCSEMGYEYSIIKTESGEQGVCIMPNKDKCDEWDFLNGKCGIEYSYCIKNGYDIEIRNDGKNLLSPIYAVCVSENKSIGAISTMLQLSEKATVAISHKLPYYNNDTMGNLLKTRANLPEVFSWAYDENSNDWTTPPNNQGICGSCWAISTIGALESIFKIKNNNPNAKIDLSEEFLVSDCFSGISSESNLYINNCRGGDSYYAMNFIKNNSVVSEKCFEYESNNCTYTVEEDCLSCVYNTNESCANTLCSNNVCNEYYLLDGIDVNGELIGINDYLSVGVDAFGWMVDSDYYNDYSQWEMNVKNYIYNYGPIVTSIFMYETGQNTWDSNNIMRCNQTINSLNNNDINHSVLVVGYDDIDKYWIVKNSWGNTWGPHGNGFFKVGYGECNINRTIEYIEGMNYCGDNYCDIGEGCNCPDCAYIPECQSLYCGDGLCDWYESSYSCALDCDAGGGGGGSTVWCVDSDGGQNYNTYGVVAGARDDIGSYANPDVCIDEINLREFYCDKQFSSGISVDCTALGYIGCENGKCISCPDGYVARRCKDYFGTECLTDEYICCSDNFSCVYDDMCYQTYSLFGQNATGPFQVDTNDVSPDLEYCEANNTDWSGFWFDKDMNLSICTNLDNTSAFLSSNDLLFGTITDDYDNDFSNGFCCGDDSNEYFVSNYGINGCTDTQRMCIDEYGDWASEGDSEICSNGIDDNCNGQIDSAEDNDGDGYSFCIDDCNDSNSSVRPGVTEICGNNIDDNCNGILDHLDVGFTDPTESEFSCSDNIDNDCDGFTDIEDPECTCESNSGICMKDPACPTNPNEQAREVKQELFCSGGGACCVPTDSGGVG